MSRDFNHGFNITCKGRDYSKEFLILDKDAVKEVYRHYAGKSWTELNQESHNAEYIRFKLANFLECQGMQIPDLHPEEHV